MELDKIEIILEKYFQGETTIAEEKELKKYFSSINKFPYLLHSTKICFFIIRQNMSYYKKRKKEAQHPSQGTERLRRYHPN